MKALLVYPKHPQLTYWSFSGALPYVGRRAALPPLGLITVASMLPEHWQVRLIDMNVAPLRDADLMWADVVMTSTMVVQSESHEIVVARCNELGIPVVAGGPHPSTSPERMKGVDHVFIGEAEGLVEALASDLERGCAKPVYRAEGLPEVAKAPVPRFDLLDLEAYASMAVQHSRGCPFNCEFCDIWKLYGRRSRVKAPERMLPELDALRDAGWRGSVFFVDDNFIGNPRVAKQSLAAIKEWQEANGFPFQLYTEASANLGSDDELMTLMRDSGFNFVFLGIETPSAESLKGANKDFNAKLDLLGAVRRIQEHGIEVSSGFIVGFDEDTDDIFDRQLAFIQEAGIPMAMVGILTALAGTDLYDRVKKEGRLLGESYGNNTHVFEANFVTKMDPGRLAEGYRWLMHELYDPELRGYFQRCRRLLDRLGPNHLYTRPIVKRELLALARSLGKIATATSGREYMKFLLWCLRRHPGRFPEAVRLAIMGFHFEAITREALACEEIRRDSGRIAEWFHGRISRLAGEARRLKAWEEEHLAPLFAARADALRRLSHRIYQLSPESRAAAAAVYNDTLRRINGLLAEHAPGAGRALEAGAHRLDQMKEALRRDVRKIRACHAELRRKAARGSADLGRELRALDAQRREAIRRAREWLHALPEEYRLFGSLELQALHRELADVTGY